MSSASHVRAWREANIWKRAYCRSLRENALLNEDIAFLRRELAAAHTRESTPTLPPLTKKRKHKKPPAASEEKKKKNRRKERLPSCVESDCGCCACDDCNEICSQCE